MSKFITGKDLENAVYDIIWDAKRTLLIVSPYIKLGEYFTKLFDRHINNLDLHLIIVFGKNEGNASKSLGKNDVDFFKKFPNVSIIYEPKLHAKYYGNEAKGVITSINLYDYSFKNNIEYGVYAETGLLNLFVHSADQSAWNKSMEIAHSGEPIFIRRPVFQKTFLSSITGAKSYLRSDVLLDTTEASNNNSYARRQGSTKKFADFLQELEISNTPQNDIRPSRAEIEGNNNLTDPGYCIRTGTNIPFNPQRPFCADAYRSWSQFENWNYPEKYCHKTGKKSYGKTSMAIPILV